MNYVTPESIRLTAEETKLYSRIQNVSTHDESQEIGDSMEALVTSLLDRNAIPKPRLLLFRDPAYAEKGTKSPQQVFEANGQSGSEMIRHPHFIQYLMYFIEGPDLPEPAVEGLCKILNDDLGTSGMLMDQYRTYVRSCVRQYDLNPRKAATEFFRLGVEIGMDLSDAHTMRDAARTTR